MEAVVEAAVDLATSRFAPGRWRRVRSTRVQCAVSQTRVGRTTELRGNYMRLALSYTRAEWVQKRTTKGRDQCAGATVGVRASWDSGATAAYPPWD